MNDNGSKDGREVKSKEGTNVGKNGLKREQSTAGRQEIRENERARNEVSTECFL